MLLLCIRIRILRIRIRTILLVMFVVCLFSSHVAEQGTFLRRNLTHLNLLGRRYVLQSACIHNVSRYLCS